MVPTYIAASTGTLDPPSPCADCSRPSPTASRRGSRLFTTLTTRLSQAPNESGTRGSVLLLGSVTTTAPVPELFATHGYAAAKGALTALMTSMAATYAADRIRVNLVAPSLTATPMARRAADDPHILEYARRKQPLAGEMMDPDEVAKAAIYFLSDESRVVTGQYLAVDGGWSVISTTAEPVP